MSFVLKVMDLVLKMMKIRARLPFHSDTGRPETVRAFYIKNDDIFC